MKRLAAIGFLFLVLLPLFSAQADACGMKDKGGGQVADSEK